MPGPIFVAVSAIALASSIILVCRQRSSDAPSVSRRDFLRELKEELGLDHYEGRHWLGWHHHVTLVTMAFAFLRTEQSRVKKNCWCEVDAGDPAADPGAVTGPAHSSGGPVPMV